MHKWWGHPATGVALPCPRSIPYPNPSAPWRRRRPPGPSRCRIPCSWCCSCRRHSRRRTAARAGQVGASGRHAAPPLQPLPASVAGLAWPARAIAAAGQPPAHLEAPAVLGGKQARHHRFLRVFDALKAVRGRVAQAVEALVLLGPVPGALRRTGKGNSDRQEPGSALAEWCRRCVSVLPRVRMPWTQFGAAVVPRMRASRAHLNARAVAGQPKVAPALDAAAAVCRALLAATQVEGGEGGRVVNRR